MCAKLAHLTTLPKNFGDGWMTKSAADMCRIAVAFGGFDAALLVTTINRIHRDKTRTVNSATVGSALQIIHDHFNDEKRS